LHGDRRNGGGRSRLWPEAVTAGACNHDFARLVSEAAGWSVIPSIKSLSSKGTLPLCCELFGQNKCDMELCAARSGKVEFCQFFAF